jgi:hypothetical protein
VKIRGVSKLVTNFRNCLDIFLRMMQANPNSPLSFVRHTLPTYLLKTANIMSQCEADPQRANANQAAAHFHVVQFFALVLLRREVSKEGAKASVRKHALQKWLCKGETTLGAKNKKKFAGPFQN